MVLKQRLKVLEKQLMILVIKVKAVDTAFIFFNILVSYSSEGGGTGGLWVLSINKLCVRNFFKIFKTR